MMIKRIMMVSVLVVAHAGIYAADGAANELGAAAAGNGLQVARPAGANAREVAGELD